MSSLRASVVCFTGNSGLTHYSVALCRELGRFCEVTFVTAENFESVLHHPSFKLKTLFRRSRHYLQDMLRFIVDTLKSRPDILLAQSVIKFAVVDALAIRFIRMTGISTALTVHDVLPHYPKPWSCWAYGFYFRSFDRLIVHSARAREEVEKMAPRQRVLTVPHGVYDIFNTLNLSRSQAASHFPSLRDEHFVFLFFGHQDRRKGLEAFLDAADTLRVKPGVRFVLAGKSALDNDPMLRGKLDRAKNDPHFIVHDHRIPFADVQFYFARADVVVLPYLEGTTSGVLKLAMAFGKPVIATDVGDLPETVLEGMGLVISHAALPSELVDAMNQAVGDYPQLQQRCIGVAAKYAWDRIAEQYFNFLADGVENERIRGCD